MPELLLDEEIDALQPTYLGPTWTRGPLGNYVIPDDLGIRTLGWEIAAWCTKYLNGLDGGRWKFTNEQFRWLLWWYAVDDRGRFVYRKGVLQRLKGWGKDPLAAVLCLIEFVGPSQFSHWEPTNERDANGMVVFQPKGKPHPRAWVQIAAVSREQTRNTMTLMPSLISQKMIDAYGIKPGAELIRAHKGRCRIEAVTSSFRALEGGRSTFVILNETHHWISANNGTQMYEVIQNNTTKMNCRYLAITNAYLPGEDSVAEKMRLNWELGQEGKDTAQDLLYDSIEAHPATPLTEQALRIVIPKIRGDAVWLNVDSIISSIKDTTVSVARSRRMWLNQIVADRDALYGPDEMKAIAREDVGLRPGDEIVLGFDGGRYDDSSALVAIRLKDRTTFLLGLWEKPSTWDEAARGRWQVDAENVDSVVHNTFRTFKVVGFFADVNLWESYIASWSEVYGDGLTVKSQHISPIAFDMRSEKAGTDAHGRLMSAIKERKVFYDVDDLALRRHTMNARTAETKWGTYFRKESKDSTRKVDAYAAWVLAHEALYRYQTNPRPEKKRTGVGHFL